MYSFPELKSTMARAINNYKDPFNPIQHTLDKFVEVKAICIRAPRILYTGYL